MTNQQFQDLLREIRPRAAEPGPRGRRIEPFSSGDPVEWRTWREAFVVAVTINQWNNQRSRREIKASMTGTAALRVQDIAIADVAAHGAAVANYVGLLDAYEARFMPAAASDLASIEFAAAKQREDETVVSWWPRLRHLYQRMNPGMNEAAINESRHLKERFMMGLCNERVREKTCDARPADYPACLEVACNATATVQMLKHADGDAAVKAEPILAMGEGQAVVAALKAGPGSKCNLCQKPGHFVKDCDIYQKAKGIYDRYLQGRNRRASGRGRGGLGGRGGRVSKRGRPGPGRGGRRYENTRRGMYAMDVTDEADNDEAPEDVEDDEAGNE